MDNEKWDKDYPQGAFVAEAVCPNCGELIKVNVPAVPESGWLKAKTRCSKCREMIYVKRWSTGAWTIWDS